MRPTGAFGILALAAGILLVSAAIFLTPLGAGITVVLMISIIGIPVALFLSLIPPLALLLALATVFAYPVRRFGWPAVVLAFLPAAAVMYYAPVLLNRTADERAFALVAGDIEGKPEAFAGRSLAIFVKPKHDNDCLDFCQRALISGAVETFIVARPKTWPEPDFSEEGVGYWLEKRQSCEPRKLRDNTRGYPVALQEPSAAPAMRLLAASGTCLVSGPKRVADADAALFHREMIDAVFDRNTLDPFYVPIRATRLSWYARDNGVLTEKLRRTAVEYMTLQAPLFPGFMGGSELRLYAGLMRQSKQLGSAEGSLKLDPLLAQLGFDLRIDVAAIEELRLTALEAALASATAPDAATQAMADDAFRELEDGGDLELATRILADRRFPASQYMPQ